jgi:hypothetical protein
MIREAKRNNTGVYREKSMQCLGRFATAFDSEDWFATVSPIIDSVLESLGEAEDEMDIDSSKAGQPSGKTM